MKKYLFLILTLFVAFNSYSQLLKLDNYEFESKKVKASIIKFAGESVIKVERDLDALPFDLTKLESTVDEPTFVELKNVIFENGVIQVKMLSQIQNPSPFKGAQGFDEAVGLDKAQNGEKLIPPRGASEP